MAVATRPKPRHPRQQCPVATMQPQTLRRLPQGDIELMSKEEILDSKPTLDLNRLVTNVPSR